MTARKTAAMRIPPAFEDPVLDAQGVFRTVMRAMSRPGIPVRLATAIDTPGGLMPATAAIALTLCDFETPVWLDDALRSEPVLNFLRFHCGCPVVDDPSGAAFALLARPRDIAELTAFNPGDDKYPERSTTLVLQVEGFDRGPTYRLCGPGIKDTVDLSVRGLPPSFPEAWATNNAQYPTGVDVMFTCGDRVTGLPRSVKLEG